jgi:3-hydroxyacyl-[acyl-carrier-protein] dehydratase
MTTLMKFEEVRAALKQRFPMLMVDCVTSLEPGKSIRTTKNVTGNEIQFLGHFPEHPVMPGTLIVEAIGQSASILFSKTTGAGMQPGEFLALGSINNMRFLAPVFPGDRLEIDVQVLKFIEDFALVEAVATVDGTVVATGKLGFARGSLQPASGKGSDTLKSVTGPSGETASLVPKDSLSRP